jgi:glutamine amidotransferase PdxT
MPYTIVFEARNTRDAFAADAATANQALAIVGALQKASEEIMFIRSPQEGDIGVEMLRVLAKEEAEEMPVALTNSL